MRILILATMLAACGAPQQTSTDAKPTVEQKATEEKLPSKTEVTEEPQIQKIVAEDGTISGIAILLQGSSLPACEVSNVGQTFYVEAESQFQSCSVDGEWRIVDLRGAVGEQGVQGEKGEKGDQGAQGEKGDSGADGADGAQGAQGIQGVQGIQGLQGIQGIQGVAGQDGADGSAGANGADGQDGTNGAGAIGAYRASDDAFLGTYLGGASVVFDGGGLADMSLGEGKFQSSYAYINGQAQPAYCTFISTDCSGTCYANNISSQISGTIKGTAFFTGTVWRKATGAETSVGALTIRSRYFNGACSNSFGSIVMNDNYPLNTGFTLPAGFSMPIGNLYIDSVH